jgi:serine/threonine protein kinase
MALNLDDRVGSYRIVRLLGEGGMGSVFEALHETIERRVALKVLRPSYAQDPAMLQRFFNEARAVNRIEHPSIVQVSDFGRAPDGTAYLVMELLRGETLSRRLCRHQTQGEGMPILTALQLAWQVADALTAAHERHIVHRDLKPDNLMLVADPIAPGGERVKLLDFGIAKLQPDNPYDVEALHTDTQLVMGAPAYMSPEQCAGAGGVDDKSDVYSLGVVLYRMLSGRVPFVADGAGQLIAMQLYREPPPLISVAPHVPLDVAALVHRLLIKDRTLRPNMADARAELGAILSKISNSVAALSGRPSLPPSALKSPSERTVDSLPHIATNSEKTPRPSSSTFDKVQGQKVHRGSGRSLRILGIAGAASLSILLGLWLFDSPSSSQLPSPPPRPAVAPPSAPPPARVERIRWQVESEPSGADIVDVEGAFMGQTPWTQEQDAAAGESTIYVRKAGYQTAAVMLKQDQSLQRHVALSPLSKRRSTSSDKQKDRPSRDRPAARGKPGSKAKGIPLED